MGYNELDAKKFHRDSVVETKWNNMAADRTLRPCQLWEFYSEVTTGTTLPMHACEADGTKVTPELNLKALMPEEGSSDLPNTVVENFNAKLRRTLFPDNRAFFAFDVPEKAKIESGVDKAKIQPHLDSAVFAIMSLLKEKGLYRVLPKTIENGTVIGNGLLYMGMSKSEPMQFISPADFVWRRTQKGIVRELIIREVIALEDVTDPELRSVLENEMSLDLSRYITEEDNRVAEPRSVQKYTYVVFDEKGNQKISTYVGQFKVGKEVTKSHKEPIFLPLALNLPIKAQYGVGKTKGAISSILQVLSSSKAWARYNSLVSDLKIGVAPSAANAIKAMAKQRTSNHVVLTNPNDMQLISWGNINLNSVDASYQVAERALSRSFLYEGGVVRDAERVTAEEIRKNAEELNASNSDLMTEYEDQLQAKLVQYGLYHLDLETEDGKTIKEALQDLDIKILTGTEAISRVSASDSLVTMLQESSVIGGVPEQVANRLKVGNILNKFAQGRGLQADEFIKSDAEIAEEAEAIQQQQQEAEASAIQTQALTGQQQTQ